MRLLLTRAAEDSARTREKLEATGRQVLVSPLIEFAGTGAAWPEGVVDAVLATSAQAFRVDLGGPLSETRRLMPLYLVGSRTAEAARNRDFRGAATIAKTAVSLAATMAERPRPRRLVYLAGRDRKPDIEAALDSMGQTVDVIEVYAARPVEQLSDEATGALGQGAVDGVLHFSRRSAALFVAAAKKADIDIDRPEHFCLSEDVAAPLYEAGCTKVRIAVEPSEADLLGRVGSA